MFQDKQLFILNDRQTLEEIKSTAIIPEQVISSIQDPFAGLASVTHCFAGNDVQFFGSEFYQAMRVMYNYPVLFSIVNFPAKLLKHIAKRLIK